MPKEITIYQNTDEYNALKQECEAIFKELLRNSREELILAYGQLGERIVNDPLYKKYGKGNQGLIENLARDTTLGEQTIYRAIQFYEKYQIVSPTSESWNKFKECKNVSWNKIKTFYLPDNKEPHICNFKQVWICGCGKRQKI